MSNAYPPHPILLEPGLTPSTADRIDVSLIPPNLGVLDALCAEYCRVLESRSYTFHYDTSDIAQIAMSSVTLPEAGRSSMEVAEGRLDRMGRVLRRRDLIRSAFAALKRERVDWFPALEGFSYEPGRILESLQVARVWEGPLVVICNNGLLRAVVASDMQRKFAAVGVQLDMEEASRRAADYLTDIFGEGGS